jgi:S1-C subfamily serine protease
MNRILGLVFLFPILGLAQLVPQVVQSCKSRNVFVKAGVGQGSWNEGSGIKIGRNRILSAFHIVNGKNNIQVDGKPAQVLKEWRERDLVLLYAETGDNPPEVELAETLPTSEVFLVGNPKSCRNKVIYGGMIGVQNGPIYDPGYKGSVWLSDVLGLPGASGGGLWDKDGRLVGVFKGWEKSGDISVIIPAGEVRKFLNSAEYAQVLAGGK